MIKIHLKSWTHFFQAIKSGEKKHDIRALEDRNFHKGQVIVLEEFDPFLGKYTGDSIECEITFITSNLTPCALSSVVLHKDYCVLSLQVLAKRL